MKQKIPRAHKGFGGRVIINKQLQVVYFVMEFWHWESPRGDDMGDITLFGIIPLI